MIRTLSLPVLTLAIALAAARAGARRRRRPRFRSPSRTTSSIPPSRRFPPASRSSSSSPIRMPTPAEFESKELRVEKVVAGGGAIAVKVRALKPGRYRFFDDYHEATTQGFLVAQ